MIAVNISGRLRLDAIRFGKDGTTYLTYNGKVIELPPGLFAGFEVLEITSGSVETNARSFS